MIDAIMKHVNASLQPLVNRVRLGLGKGVLHLVSDSGPVQTVQAGFLPGETRDGMERPQDYGFSSHPLAGMQAFAGFFGGDRSNGFIIAMCDRQYRVKLAQGEVVVYDDLGQKVHLTRTGIIAETPLDVSVIAGGDASVTAGGDASVTAGGDASVTAGQKLRLHATDIELHAAKSLSWDVAGFGERWTWTAANAWEHKTWQTGAIVTDIALPINPPEGP